MVSIKSKDPIQLSYQSSEHLSFRIKTGKGPNDQVKFSTPGLGQIDFRQLDESTMPRTTVVVIPSRMLAEPIKTSASSKTYLLTVETPDEDGYRVVFEGISDTNPLDVFKKPIVTSTSLSMYRDMMQELRSAHETNMNQSAPYVRAPYLTQMDVSTEQVTVRTFGNCADTTGDGRPDLRQVVYPRQQSQFQNIERFVNKSRLSMR